MIPHSFRRVSFIYPNLDLHVAGVACKPGDAYSSGAPGLASMLEVHVYPPFLSFSRPTDYANRLTLGYIVVFIYLLMHYEKTVCSVHTLGHSP